MGYNTQNLVEPWKPGQSGNPKGRPKNRVPEVVAKILGSKSRATALRKCTINETEAKTWESLVFSMNLDQLKVLAQSELTPMYPKGLAVALLTDMKNGTTKTLDKLREWQFGKAAQSVEVKGMEPLTIEVIDSRSQVDELEEETGSEE